MNENENVVENVETDCVIDNDGKTEIRVGGSKSDTLAAVAGAAVIALVAGAAGNIGSKIVDGACYGFANLKEYIEEKKEEAEEKKAEKKAKKAKEED